MFRIASLALALIAAPLAAQKSVQAFPASGQLTVTGHFVGMMEEGHAPMPVAFALINYTPSTWKPEWNDQTKLDQATTGHTIRLGKNNWATIDLTAPIVFGNVTVPTGIYYLGVSRDKSGKWMLSFIDPVECKKSGAWPPSPMSDLAPHAYEAPLTVAKTSDNVETLEVTMKPDEKQPAKGTFTIKWGNQMATASYELRIPAGTSDAAGKKK
jgi:hypothetical protein